MLLNSEILSLDEKNCSMSRRFLNGLVDTNNIVYCVECLRLSSNTFGDMGKKFWVAR